MGEVTLSRFLASAINIPIMIPLVLLLIPRWRYPKRTLAVVATVVEGVLILGIVLIYRLFGATLASTWLVGTILPVASMLLFVLLSELKPGQVFFLLATAALSNSMCDSLADIFTQRSEGTWIAVKIVIFTLQAVLIWFLCRKPLLEMLEAHSSMNWGKIAYLPLALCVTLSSYHVAPITSGLVRFPVIPTVLLYLSIIMVYITIYQLQNTIIARAEAKQDATLLRSEIDFLSRQTTAAESVNMNMRIFRHDIRHYINLLRAGLTSGDGAAMVDILDSLEENLNIYSNRVSLRTYTGDALLDSILTQGAGRAEAMGVAFEVQFSLPEKLEADRAELAVVVSNAVENALNAVGQEPVDRPRRVEVKGLPKGDHLLLLVINTFTGELILEPETGLPRAEEEGHGYGTYSMAKFAHKYGGAVDCYVKDGTYTLRLYI